MATWSRQLGTLCMYCVNCIATSLSHFSNSCAVVSLAVGYLLHSTDTSDDGELSLLALVYRLSPVFGLPSPTHGGICSSRASSSVLELARRVQLYPCMLRNVPLLLFVVRSS